MRLWFRPRAQPTPPAPSPPPVIEPPEARFQRKYAEAWQTYWSQRHAPTRDELDAWQTAQDAAQAEAAEDRFITQLVRGGGVVWVSAEDRPGSLGQFRTVPDLRPFGRLATLDEWSGQTVENS
jgi:hypothetical protein